jgi:exopolyphosphatase/guanosine-5'-triphosphate,3'-diphosphate pyrophosphatase
MANDGGALAAVDIGTNSIHLVVARPAGDDRFETLTREREMVRLGHGGGDMKELSSDAIDRGVATLQRMRRIADGYGATVRAVATSAVREAVNAGEFLRRAHGEAGVDVEVISGVEEARLIQLGVLQTVPVYDQRLLLVDIGGGSTEVLLGERGDTIAARSFKLGAVRATDRFFPGGAVTPRAVRDCRDYARDILSHFQHEVATHGFDVAVASSGTAEAIARMVHAASGSDPLRTYNAFEFTATEISAVVEELLSHRTAATRTKVRGLDPGRADIIVAGALILETVATTFGVERFRFSEGALRDGVLVDTVSRQEGGRTGTLHHLRDVSRRSIRQLAERCDDDPAHSAHVAALAVELFDELAPIHQLDATAREYLEAGALLANVGLVVAHSKHHIHAYYVIRNSELAGLTDAEIEVIAQIARYHRKSAPKPSHPDFAALPPADQELVRALAAILRVAIGLDRSHQARVRHVRGELGPDRVVIHVESANGADTSLELYAADERKELLEAVIGRRLELVASAR